MTTESAPQSPPDTSAMSSDIAAAEAAIAADVARLEREATISSAARAMSGQDARVDARSPRRCQACRYVLPHHAAECENDPEWAPVAAAIREREARGAAKSSVPEPPASLALAATLTKMQDQLNSMGLMLAQNRNALLTKREELAAHEANYTDWEKRVVGEMRTLQNEITNLKARSEGNG